ncbi:class I SAM-dependent methyltransferase [Rhodococcus sp. IEGM 1408]|uniref:class I SAM-dependent methyltransferase n=1 Tax=Rhodococcus sp. IEGM 1408 TaxID=3082220 RepID=UPI002952BA7E|nr:class I SAM-dependent methyltransferase [Rhodococcus sp. IEGM 1408]MDV8000241.1 class I SAM-dependent methyltransferase [Rhodococcus sp. IEGM 1408]
MDNPPDFGVVIDWGCGGGANAAAIAPTAKRFIAADVSRESLDECVRQVGTVCSTPIEPLHIDIEHPERAITGLEDSCDIFLCLYVLELTTGPEEALRILRIAERLLVPGGMAFVQIKYHTAGFRPPMYKRNYRRNLANMTTFGIDEFWLRSAECGLTPQLILLVPENQLDSKYAYYALTKPTVGATLDSLAAENTQ